MPPQSAANTQADQFVRQGFQLQNVGQLDAAQSAYLEALRLTPEHPAALQLLGVLARRAGQLSNAEALMQRSLRAQHRQPHVWNNLGSLLDDLGRADEALACFDTAIAQEPRYGDAHYNRALILHQLGRRVEALQAIERVLTLSTQPSAPVLQLKALVQTEQGDLAPALATVDQALQLAPERAALHHNRATVLQQLHRHQESLAAHERAQALGLDVADAHYNHGNTLQSLGRLDDAAAAYRRTLHKDPGHWLALYDLARLRWRQADPDFDAELQKASAAQPASAVAPGLRAQLLMNAERHADATAAYRQALALQPQAAGLRSGLARCLAKLGDLAQALHEHAQAVALAPQDATVRACQAAALLEAGRAELAAQAIQVARDLAPTDQYVLAVQGLAWRVLGDPREAWLNDVERQVRVVDLPPPVGFGSMADFNLALTQELLALHKDAAAPVDQTLRRGTQTLGDIFEQGHPLVDLLKVRIAEAVDAHISSFTEDAQHPLLGRRQASWRFTDSWSSRLGQGGFHTNHVHPHGWISSAYYVQVPPASADPVRQEGWLQFGEPDFNAGLSQPVRRRVQPLPGRLALFPSYLWHGTTPFSDDAPRLTIAFDVMPLAAPR